MVPKYFSTFKKIIIFEPLRIKMDSLSFFFQIARGMHFGILDAVLGRPDKRKLSYVRCHVFISSDQFSNFFYNANKKGA